MRKLLCPQCKIAGLYVKNEKKERLLVYVSDEGEVVPRNLEENMEGFDLTIVYCLGCSLNPNLPIDDLHLNRAGYRILVYTLRVFYVSRDE